MRTKRASEAGDALTETVLVVPALMLAIMLAFQVGLWWHGRHVVAAAARDAVRVARLEGSAPEAGRERAESFLAASSALVLDPHVEVESSGGRVRAVVTGRSVAVVPGMELLLRSAHSGVVEAPGAEL